MIVCWDASALVKLLRAEDGREVAERLWRAEASAMASTLAVPEVSSALARAHRARTLASLAYEAAVRSAGRLFEELDLFAVTAQRAQRAADLVVTHHLRVADAVHLATALDVADSGGEVVLATFDRRLHEAAFDLGVSVAPAAL